MRFVFWGFSFVQAELRCTTNNKHLTHNEIDNYVYPEHTHVRISDHLNLTRGVFFGVRFFFLSLLSMDAHVTSVEVLQRRDVTRCGPYTFEGIALDVWQGPAHSFKRWKRATKCV
jgi:hypothetical protein